MEETTPPSTFAMVPVPQEFVLDVMRYVLRLSVNTLKDWDLGAIGQLFGLLDEFPRRLLTHVAECTARGETLEFGDARELFNVPGAGLYVAARDVIGAAAHLHREQPFGLEHVPVDPETPDDSVRVYVMDVTVADLILQHAQSTANDAPSTADETQLAR